MQKIKCVVVGDCDAKVLGEDKTSLICRYVNCTNWYCANYSNHSLHVTVDDGSYDLDMHNIFVQNEFDRLRPLTYVKTDVFIICFSLICPVSFENVRTKWYSEIHHWCPDTPIILVGNKIEFVDEQDTLNQLREQKVESITYNQVETMCKEIEAIKYMECSVKLRENIKEIFDEAIRAAITPRAKTKKKSRCSLL